MASILLKSSETNADPVDITSVSDVRRYLGELDLSAEELEKAAETFLHCTIKLEGVDTRAANLIRSYLETLGGGIAMSRGAKDYTVRETDMLINGSRRTLLLLAARLKGEPYGLDAVSADIIACTTGGNRTISWGNRTLDFTHKTYVMGILNCTPDSFFPSSRAATIKDAMKSAHEMIAAGVDIVDVGGESSRPGSDPVPVEEEIRRVIPVVQALRAASDVILSVDTRKKEIAERALDAGADIINDISGLRHNEDLARLVARRKVPVVLMHMRGTPKTMQKSPFYKNTISEIIRELQPSIAAAIGAGISPEMIIIDPGIGFGKRSQDNLRIIKELASLKSLKFPILVGLSRKGFIGEILDRPVEKRLIGTVTANTLAILNGANIIRVHDVADAVEMVKIIDSIRRIGAQRFMEQLLNTWAVREVVRPVLDVLMLSYLLYKSWQILVQTRAVQLIKGTVLMVLIYAVSFFLQLTTLLWILNVLVPGLVIAIAIVFQPELRKIFTQIGSREWFRVHARTAAATGGLRLDLLMNAVQQLSVRRRGALIVFPRRVGIRNIVQTGTRLDAEISMNLISTVFFEGTQLHDGAMIVEGGRIVAAGCFLPLSDREDVESAFGARHRAALGLAEDTDALIVVVSEENGAVSLAHDGEIRYNIPLTEVEAGLRSLLLPGVSAEGRAAARAGASGG